MIIEHWVVFSLLSLCVPPFFFTSMHNIRVGSLNINGGRDPFKRTVGLEMIIQKKLDVLFLQETHTDHENEIEWGISWKGNYFLSHGTRSSAGVAILFSPGLIANIKSQTELVPGRVLVIRAEIEGFYFGFINVYAPNQGVDRIEAFKKIHSYLQQSNQNECVVMGGDWNCTTNFTTDRTGEEPHLPSSFKLVQLISELNLVDAWRNKHPQDKQYG